MLLQWKEKLNILIKKLVEGRKGKVNSFMQLATA